MKYPVPAINPFIDYQAIENANAIADNLLQKLKSLSKMLDKRNEELERKAKKKAAKQLLA